MNSKIVIDRTEALPTHDATICKHIQSEEKQLMKCFGDLYDLLLADKIDYTNLTDFPQYKGTWKEATTYAQDDLVMYCGEVYKASAATLLEPGCTDDWVLQDVFTTECYNKFWNDASLVEYLAWGIYNAVLPFVHIDTTALGFQVQDDNRGSSQAATKFFFGIYLSKVATTVTVRLNNIWDWIKKDADDCNIMGTSSSCDPVENCEPENECVAWGY